jgi:membrane glycosyltransferase
VLAGAALEAAFSLLLAPVSTVNKSRFLLALALGRRAGWRPQNRADRGVAWADAARLLWWHSALGVLAFAVLAATAPWTIPFFLVWGGGLLVAIPFCVATAAPGFGRWLVARRIAATPEELLRS